MLRSDYAVRQEAVAAFLNEIVVQLYAKASGPADNQFRVPVIADAASMQRILSEPARFRKSFGFLNLLGHSRFNTNGTDWEFRRDITQKAFSSAGRRQNVARISEVYNARFASCEASLEGVQRALLSASSMIFFEALGCEVEVEPLLNFFDRAREYVKRLQYYSWNLPSASDAATLRERGNILIDDFRTEIFRSTPLKNLMGIFRARAGKAEGFDPAEELLMNFFAGVETTAATLSFAIDRLGIDSRVRDRLRKEVHIAQSETYLSCFIQETLRYFPAIPFVVREVASDTTIDDAHLRAGQTVLLSIVGLHHNPRYWIDPDIFDCSRSEFISNTYDRRAFLPFLGGPRMCGGAKLARFELEEGLKAFIRHFDISGQTDEIGFDYGLALRPRSRGAPPIIRLES